MPSPYPILETWLSKGYAVEFSMGNDRWFYLAASHPAKKCNIESGGKTISEAVIMLDSRLKDFEAVEHRVQSDEIPAWLCDCGYKHLKPYAGLVCSCGAVFRR